MNGAPLHGGDVRGIARAGGLRAADLLDFSANINPLGPPAAVRRLVRRYANGGWLERYPEPGLPELAAVLARARGVDATCIVIHGGSAPLFDTLLRAGRPRCVGLCAPAFAEYARAARANGIAVHSFALDPDAAPPFDADRFAAWLNAAGIDLAIVTNPHNPLGFALDAATVLRVRSAAPATTLVVDEAFADYAEAHSVAVRAATDPGLIVVRSVTKFYAIPDLRVGYAVMTPERARELQPFIPAWPVSGIAAAAAALAVADAGYAVRTRRSNARERARLAAGLTRLGLRVLPAAANFLTCATPDGGALCAALLARERIVLRDCSSFAGLTAGAYVRIAVRSARDDARLLAALARLRRRSPALFSPR